MSTLEIDFIAQHYIKPKCSRYELEYYCNVQGWFNPTTIRVITNPSADELNVQIFIKKSDGMESHNFSLSEAQRLGYALLSAVSDLKKVKEAV